MKVNKKGKSQELWSQLESRVRCYGDLVVLQGIHEYCWKLPGIEPRTPGHGFCSQCSVTELQQTNNHQPLQFSIMYCRSGAGIHQFHTWQPLSMCPLDHIF